MDQVPLEERLLAGWSRRLKELTPLVGGLVRDKEDTFLDLGQKVYEVNAQAREFCSEAGKLTDLSSGRLIESVLDEIRSSFVQMQRICKESGFEDGMDYLRRTLESVHALERLMAEFRQVVRNLRMMGVSTRIESARMDEGSRGFETIAEELEQLAQHVVTHTYRIQGETKALSGRVARAQEGLGQILSLQKQCADGFFSSISRDIGRLEAMEVKAAATASELAGRMEEIGSSVGEMVASIQFHDITRQRVEHVEEALQEVLCIIDRQSEEGRQFSDAELVSWFGDVVGLQSSQLRSAVEHFCEAVESLVTHLHGVGERIADLDAKLHGLIEAPDATGGSTFESMERHLTKVGHSFRRSAREGRRIGETMDSLVNTVSELALFIEDIEEIGNEVELIALNANVKSAHTGEEGKSLGVLAGAIHKLSHDACSKSRQVAGVLKEIQASAGVLHELALRAMDTEPVNRLTSDIDESVKKLLGIDEEIREAFARALQLGTTMEGEISRLVPTITLHQMIETDSTQIESALLEMAAESRDNAHPEASAKRSNRLEQLLERYTMDSERLVHQALLQEASGGDEGEDEEQVVLFGEAAPESEYGDNVELF